MNRMSQRIKTRKDDGFTLIELLIVIVVLGILAGIAIFAVDAFQADAKNACTDANSRIDKTVSAAQKVNGSGVYTAEGGNCT
ncbi:MAG: prepilin-type N-terminal cleavage/methylation domain-containing protein [Mycobacteriales bacterium]|nr:prepilin-type N-terminal cleavage/methylation domain-containing protein [Mycobacteriales bacterium]